MIPWKYRNVINPSQTEREIKLAARFIDRMLQKLGLDEQAQLELVNANKPDRVWRPI